MPVDTTRAIYDEFASYWSRLRDAASGEDAVKRRTTQYLPAPSSLGDRPETTPEYRNYLSRARYPEAVGPAVEGMVGLMARKPPAIEMPEALEYLHEQATADGLPLDALIDRLRHEVSLVGRYILLVDVDDAGDPYIATYPAEAAINWEGNAERLTLLVLEEQYDAAEDPFEHKTETQWRACRVDEDGRYVVEIYRRPSKEHEPILYETISPVRQGESFSFVPAVIVGSRDLMPEPDSIPLLSVANKSLHWYRRSADHGMQLYMAAHGTTPYLFGANKDERPQSIGPATIWFSEHTDASAGFIEVTGAGLDASAKDLDEIRREIIQATIQAMSESKRDAEAAETLRLRFQAQTATLSSIAISTARGIERALRYAAWWAGAAAEPGEESVTVEQSTAFITESPDPQMLSALYEGAERGHIPQELIARYTRRTELHEMEDEEFIRWTVAGQAVPADE